MYDQFKDDKHAHWVINPDHQGRAGSGTLASSTLTGSAAPANDTRYFRMVSSIPQQGGPWHVTGLLAHEGAHLLEALDRQMTARELFERHDGSAYLNELACGGSKNCQHYETKFAKDLGQQAESEAREAPTASSSSIINSIASDVFGETTALFDFGGTLWIDGINLSGVLNGPSR